MQIKASVSVVFLAIRTSILCAIVGMAGARACDGIQPSAVLDGRIDIALAEIKRNAGDYKGAEVYLHEAMTASAKDPVGLASGGNGQADLLL
jgi:hypothetical protein